MSNIQGMPAGNPVVEILLATYNGEKYLQNQLGSLLSQSYRNWVLLIRDDGSTDDTLSIIQEYHSRYPEKIKILQDTDTNLGSTKNFARLMQASKEAYIMFCDQDDVWMNNKIELSLKKLLELEYIKGNSTPLLVFSDLTLINNNSEVIAPSFWQAQRLDPGITRSTYKTVAQSTITGCTILINRPALIKALPVDIPGLQHDHWLGICVAYYGYISYLTIPTILYRIHDNNEVGLKTPGLRYLWGRLQATAKLWNTWVKIRTTRDIQFSLLKAALFKVWFNLKRMFQHYSRP